MGKIEIRRVRGNTYIDQKGEVHEIGNACACKFHNCRGKLKAFVGSFGGKPKMLCSVHYRDCMDIDAQLLREKLGHQKLASGDVEKKQLTGVKIENWHLTTGTIPTTAESEYA